MALLPYDPAPLGPLTAELDRWREALDRRRVLPRRWLGRLRRELEAEAVAASTAMEGVPVTVDEVRRILAGAAVPEVAEEDRVLVAGYRDAMSYVLRRADDETFRWDAELVMGIHDRVLGGRLSEEAGRVRTTKPAFVVNSLTGRPVFLPPSGEDVAALLEEACARMEAGHPHPAIASAWIHVAVAGIHPFRDGNGRVARILASLAMYRGGFRRPELTSLEEWWGRHLPDYYSAFACLGGRFDRAADATGFLLLHAEAQLSQVRALDARQRVEREIWTALEEVCSERGLPARTAHAVWDAFFGRDVTAGYYRSVADVSPATATNDLGKLVAAGLLDAKGERRGRRYHASDALFTEVGRILAIGAALPQDSARAQIVAELGTRGTEAGEALGL